MKLVVRFAGILTFAHHNGRLVVLAPEASSPDDLRPIPPKKLDPHRPHIELVNASLPLPPAEDHWFSLDVPRGAGPVDLSPFQLLNLTDACHRSMRSRPPSLRRRDVSLSSELLTPDYDDFRRSLVASAFELWPGRLSVKHFEGCWPMTLLSLSRRKFPAEISAHFEIADGDPSPKLLCRPLRSTQAPTSLEIPEPDNGDPVEIRFNNLCADDDACDPDHNHFLIHYHVMTTPQHLVGRRPVPADIPVPALPERNDWPTPLRYGPESLNPQCSPVQLEVDT